MLEPRDYQTKAKQDVRAALVSKFKRPLLVMPTAAGKTVVAADIIHAAVAKNKYVLFLAPRRELIYQTSEKLYAVGVEHGMIMAGEKPRLFPSCQVATVPTLHRRLKDKRIPPPRADLIFCDEAHLHVTPSGKFVLDHYPGVPVVGMTATAARGDGKSLGELFDTLVLGPSVKSLIEQGYLSPPEYYAPSKPDLEGLKIIRGDYEEEGLGRRMDVPKLVGDVVANWHRLAHDRQTLVFAVNVAHSLHLKDAFLASGVSAEHIDADTPKEARRAILNRYKAGEIQVLCNCEVMTTGTDLPMTGCIVYARPTKSLVLYLQIGGRGLRIHPGKTNCLILDHAGVIDEHGYLEDDVPWSLSAAGKVQDRKKQLVKALKQPKAIVCRKCAYVFTGRPDCPKCGTVTQRPKKDVGHLDGRLEKVQRNGEKRPDQWSMAEKRQFYAGLLGHSMIKGYKRGWAAWAYREKFGVWPNAMKSVTPLQPSAEVASYVRHLNIRRAKARSHNEAIGIVQGTLAPDPDPFR